MRTLIKKWLLSLLIEIFRDNELPCKIVAEDFKATGLKKECEVCGETNIKICNNCFYRNR